MHERFLVHTTISTSQELAKLRALFSLNVEDPSPAPRRIAHIAPAGGHVRARLPLRPSSQARSSLPGSSLHSSRIITWNSIDIGALALTARLASQRAAAR
jgi:hypothetical protein